MRRPWVKLDEARTLPHLPTVVKIEADREIITPHNEDLAKFNRDGSTGQIYISHLPGHSELHLIIPFKNWPNH
jgi:hypothetical protein